MKQIDGEEE